MTATRQDVFAEQLSKIPEFQQLGPLFKSSQPVELTESETEYVVQCIKHVFARHVVLQVSVAHTWRGGGEGRSWRWRWRRPGGRGRGDGVGSLCACGQ